MTACWARCAPCRPTTASTSPPSTASSGPAWPAGPCWTSAPTRCPWPPGASGHPHGAWPSPPPPPPADARLLGAGGAGGPLLDLGPYPVSLAPWVLGPPQRVVAVGQPHPAGVNGQAAAALSDPHGNPAAPHT